MSALNAFDRIAPVYDWLSGLVFGDALDKSQLTFLGSIRNGSHVLMIGGGTGKSLESLLSLTHGCKVWYVEASSVMIARARQRIGSRSPNVVFIHGNEDSIPAHTQFDVIITGFFLDLFPEEKVGKWARRVGHRLREEGSWLITDFVGRDKWWQRLLLWSMYRFFILTCGIKGRRLPRWEYEVGRNGFAEKHATFYFGRFIKSSVWLKSSS